MAADAYAGEVVFYERCFDRENFGVLDKCGLEKYTYLIYKWAGISTHAY